MVNILLHTRTSSFVYMLCDCVLQANRAAGGSKREKQTMIINALIRRKDGKLTVNENTQVYTETVTRSHSNFRNKYGEGFIEAEAANKVGGVANLMNAVQAGQVRTAETDGLKLYFFPRMQIGTKEQVQVLGGTTGVKAIDDDTFSTLRESITLLGTTLASSSASSGTLAAVS